MHCAGRTFRMLPSKYYKYKVHVFQVIEDQIADIFGKHDV